VRDEDDVIESTLEFERKRSLWQLWMASLDVTELVVVARDVAKMLEYAGNQMEVAELNRQLLMGAKHTEIKPGDAA
jgi:hypothetical protein